MSKNIDQVFTANPITTNASTDLMYFGQSPYSSGDDAAMLFSNFSAQFGAPYTAAALTSGNDTNVTLTLGGTPSTALLHAASITAGWTGTLAVTRGGTGSGTASGARSNLGAAASGANSDITSMTGLTGKIEAPTAIASATGLNVLGFSYTASAVNYINIENSITGEAPLITATGSDASVNMNLQAKGGVFEFSDQTATNAASIELFDAAGTNAVGFSAPSTLSGNTVWQLPSADGTNGQVVTTNGSKVLSFTTVSGSSGPFTQSGSYSAYGPGANSTMGTSSFALGNGAEANGNDSIAVGASSRAGGSSTIALGNSAFATGSDSIVLGASATSTSFNNTVVLGANAIGGANFAVALGSGAVANGIGSLALGEGVTANNLLSTVIGGGGGSGTYSDTASNQFTASHSGGYFFAKNSSILWFSIDSNGNLINSFGTADQSASVQTPTTGFSITIAAGVKTLALTPAGALLAGTITMPAAPIDKQEIRVSSSQTVTTLTVSANSGQSILNAPTTITAGSGFSYLYNLATTTWIRLY